MIANKSVFDNLKIDEKQVHCIVTLYGPRTTPEVSICSDDTGTYYLCVKVFEMNAYNVMDYHFLVIQSNFSDIHMLLSGEVSLMKLFQQSEFFWSYRSNKLYTPKYPTQEYFQIIENRLPATYFNYAKYSKEISEFFRSAELIIRDMQDLSQKEEKKNLS